MDHDLELEELFVTSFVKKDERAKLRRWLADASGGGRDRVRDKLPHRFEALLDPRFVVAEGVASSFERGRRPRYHIAANRGLDARWMSEHDFRLENGGYYDALIAILDPEHAALYVPEGGTKRVYLVR
ncbi:MAG: hypothetical protein Q8P18_22900 [Pseudomonadota bacterium]|nr:hypothetical protein [Pseudomonadota bacterium]